MVLTASEAFKPHFKTLARVGYFKLLPESQSEIKKNIHNAYRAVVWFIVIIYNLQHIIRVIQCRHSSDQIVNILFILLTVLNTLSKQLAFNLRSRRIDTIVNILDGPVFAPQKPYHEVVMKANAAMMRQLLRWYVTSLLVCLALFSTFPLVNRALGVKVEFTGYFPFETDQSPTFEIAVVYMNFFLGLQGLAHVSMDCTIVAFFAQIKVQLHILRYNLENLVNEDNSEWEIKRSYSSHRVVTGYKDDDETFKSNLKNRLVQCVDRHLQINWFVQEVEGIFAGALLFQLFVASWVICMTVYKIVGLNSYAETITMVIYLCIMLGQLFLYCYYGTQVKYESELVNQSIYCGEWLSVSPRFRRHLLLMMENCKQPITPRTASIIPISLETYIAVLRASYTLYTFLGRK